jgi:O-antigen ligase
VLSVLGKDATLTGRTVLWAQVVSHIEDRPLLGHGYGAFWAPTAAAPERIRTAIGWDTPHSHNGLLDEWLDLGFVGVLCLLGAYFLSLRRAWSGLRETVAIDGLWAMGFLVMLFLGNTTESSISSSLLLWAIFVAVASMRWPSRRKHVDAKSHSRGRPRATARAIARR